MNHTTLQQTLKAYSNNPSVIPFFYSYLSDRSQYVCANGKLPAEDAMQTDVPQGSTLGLLLFSIFINDLPLHIRDKKVRNSLNANDSSLDTTRKTPKEMEVTLQKSINEVSDWRKKNRMGLHPKTKPKFMVLTTRQKHQQLPPSPPPPPHTHTQVYGDKTTFLLQQCHHVF